MHSEISIINDDKVKLLCSNGVIENDFIETLFFIDYINQCDKDYEHFDAKNF